MCEKQENQGPLVTADEVCKRLTKNLQKQFTAASDSDMKTLPFWVLSFKETLLYRSTELAATAIDLYRRNALVSAAIITRSLLETTASFNRLNEFCVKFVKNCERDDQWDLYFQQLSKEIEKISLGTTDKSISKLLPNSVKPFEASKMIKSLGEKFKFDAYDGAYTKLCQKTHPNSEGCISAFSVWKTKELCVEFIQDYHHMQEDADFFQTLLVALLTIVEELDKEMEEILPKFTRILEEYEKKQRDKSKEQNR